AAVWLTTATCRPSSPGTRPLKQAMILRINCCRSVKSGSANEVVIGSISRLLAAFMGRFRDASCPDDNPEYVTAKSANQEKSGRIGGLEFRLEPVRDSARRASAACRRNANSAS